MAKKSIIGTVTEGFAESTRNIQAINKENMAAVKADTKANFDEATVPNPDFVKFRQAKGIGNKIKVIVENIKEGAKENTEKEKARQAKIKSHESYQVLLEEQRIKRQATIRGAYSHK